jgi:homoserine dehydrogenase
VHAASDIEAVPDWLAGHQVPVRQATLSAVAEDGMGPQVLVLTQPVRQGVLDLALHALEARPQVAGKITALRVEELS